MKPYKTLIVSVLLSALFHYSSFAQTTYTINPSTTWSAKTGSASWCGTCTFNIAAGQTLTLNMAATCGNCTFNGGNIIISAGFSCQGCTFNNDTITITNNTLNLQSSTTTFNSTILTASGTSEVKATSNVTITNSKFTFNGTSDFNNNGGQYNSGNSTLTFNGNSYFTATSGPVNLINNSRLIAGDGSLASGAYISMNFGTGLNLYDASSIKISNYNNYYFNWSTYYSAATSTTVTTTSNMLNCNGTYPHACNSPNSAYLYGCALLSKSGAVPCTPLAVNQVNLVANSAGPSSVLLSWSVSQGTMIDHCIVQRVQNGQDWVMIGTVTGQAYTATDDYSFTDPSPLSGTNIYRVAIVDIDGSMTYSKSIPVTMTTTTGSASIYPSPITGQTFHLKAVSPDPVVVNIYTQTGQLLFSTSLKGQTQYEVRMPSTVPHNTYLVIQVIGHDKTQAFPLFNQ